MSLCSLLYEANSSNPPFQWENWRKLYSSLMAKAETHSLIIDLCLDHSGQGILDWTNSLLLAFHEDGWVVHRSKPWLAQEILTVLIQ